MIALNPSRWWDKSLNLVTGCTPIGAGCTNCWAARFTALRPVTRGLTPGEIAPFSTVLLHPDRLEEPRHRKKPTLYAVSLLGDLFHRDVPREIQKAAVGLAVDTPRHRYVWLTKRWTRAAAFCMDCPPPTDNVILLGSAWDQKSAYGVCRTFAGLPPGQRWGLHMEPLLGPIDLPISCYSWVVVGPENGPGRRPCDPRWIDALQEQCQRAGIPFWHKTKDGLGVHERPW